jgi:hypothetical protein
MGTDIRVINGTIADNAAFQAWGTAIHNMLTTAGLVQTSDTGQVDVTTMTIPGSNNTSAGYRVYKLNDSWDATRPIYFRINFMRGAAATTARADFFLGAGSNGAGTLNDSFNATIAVALGETVQFCVVNHTYGMFAARINNTFVLAHRWGDLSNPEVSSGDGFTRAYISGSSASVSSWEPIIGSNACTPGIWASPYPTTTTSTFVYNTTHRLARCYGWEFGAGRKRDLRGIYGRHRGDFIEHIAFTWAADGVTTRTWLPVGSGSYTPRGTDLGTSNNGVLLVVWE